MRRKMGCLVQFGGQYVPDILIPALNELTTAYEECKNDLEFQRELVYYFKNYIGRPSALYYAQNLSEHLGGARIYLVRGPKSYRIA